MYTFKKYYLYHIAIAISFAILLTACATHKNNYSTKAKRTKGCGCPNG